MNVQSNLINLKSLGLEVLFWIISSSNYREVDMKNIYPPELIMIQVLFSIKHMFWVCKRNVSMRRFFYASKTYAVRDSY